MLFGHFVGTESGATKACLTRVVTAADAFPVLLKKPGGRSAHFKLAFYFRTFFPYVGTYLLTVGVAVIAAYSANNLGYVRLSNTLRICSI